MKYKKGALRKLKRLIRFRVVAAILIAVAAAACLYINGMPLTVHETYLDINSGRKMIKSHLFMKGLQYDRTIAHTKFSRLLRELELETKPVVWRHASTTSIGLRRRTNHTELPDAYLHLDFITECLESFDYSPEKQRLIAERGLLLLGKEDIRGIRNMGRSIVESKGKWLPLE